MTYERRESILSKEVITTEEFAELFGISYKEASTQVNAIKRRIECNGGLPRISTCGKLHIQDYLDVFRIPVDRYSQRVDDEGKTSDEL